MRQRELPCKHSNLRIFVPFMKPHNSSTCWMNGQKIWKLGRWPHDLHQGGCGSIPQFVLSPRCLTMVSRLNSCSSLVNHWIFPTFVGSNPWIFRHQVPTASRAVAQISECLTGWRELTAQEIQQLKRGSHLQLRRKQSEDRAASFML